MQSAPEPVSTSLIYRPVSWDERLALAEMFPIARLLEVELGSGDGSFMAKWAALWPERNFIGVERLIAKASAVG